MLVGLDERLGQQVEHLVVDHAGRSEGIHQIDGGGYDAVHLAVALAARVDIVATSDDRLLAAAHRRGFDVSNPARPAV